MKFEKLGNKPVNEDERGKIYKFLPGIIKELVIVKRKKGAISGNHYHKGINEARNPERFVIVSGSARINLKDLITYEQEEFIAREGDEIVIYPYINHIIEALEDDTIFIELKKEEDDYKDVFRLE